VELSAPQRDYAARVASGTGLNRRVVTAWVAQESGWSTIKDGHNYLNIGPGRTYPSVAAAAQAAVQLLQHDRYAAIRAARTPRGQLDAIVQSPWDQDRYHHTLGADGQITSRLHRTYESIGTLTQGEIDTEEELAGVISGSLPHLAELLGLSNLADEALQVLLVVLFAAAALGLIVLALWRLTEPVKGQILKGVL